MKCPREILERSGNVVPVASLESNSSVLMQSQIVATIPGRDVDFSEYEWMGEEMEEFDQKCLDEFLEEEFIEACFEDMLDEEEEVSSILDNLTPEDRISLVDVLDRMSLSEGEDSLIPQIVLVNQDSSSDVSYDGEEEPEDR